MYDARFAGVVLTDVDQKWGLVVCERRKLLVGGEEKDFSLYVCVEGSGGCWEENFGSGALGRWVVTHGRGRDNKTGVCVVALMAQQSSGFLALGLSLAPFRGVSKPFGGWRGGKAAPPGPVVGVLWLKVWVIPGLWLLYHGL